MGERWRKATPADKRYGAGVFFLLAVMFIVTELMTHFGHAFTTFMQRVSPIGLWLAFVAVVSLMVFGSLLWARHVAMRVSLILAVVAWAVLLSLVFYFEWL